MDKIANRGYISIRGFLNDMRYINSRFTYLLKSQSQSQALPQSHGNKRLTEQHILQYWQATERNVNSTVIAYKSWLRLGTDGIVLVSQFMIFQRIIQFDRLYSTVRSATHWNRKHARLGILSTSLNVTVYQRAIMNA